MDGQTDTEKWDQTARRREAILELMRERERPPGRPPTNLLSLLERFNFATRVNGLTRIHGSGELRSELAEMIAAGQVRLVSGDMEQARDEECFLVTAECTDCTGRKA
jgi:hypothetical protein